jgi:hypothetical protein
MAMRGADHDGRWVVKDFIGREWRLSIVINAEAGDALSRPKARETIANLVYFAFAVGIAESETAAALLDIYMELTGRSPSHLGWWSEGLTLDTAERVGRELEWAAECGRLRAEAGWDWTKPTYVEHMPDAITAPETPDPEPPSLGASTLEVLDWIEIILRDDQGQPVADARCILTFADSSVLESLTGTDGRVRADAIAPGLCSVEFPDHHAMAGESETDALPGM